MDLTMTPIEFIQVLEELVGWIGKQVSVYTSYGGYAGGSSFVDRLTRVETMDCAGDPLLLHFEGESVVSLSPDRMRSYRVTNSLTETGWLTFAVDGRRVLDLEEVQGNLD